MDRNPRRDGLSTAPGDRDPGLDGIAGAVDTPRHRDGAIDDRRLRQDLDVGAVTRCLDGGNGGDGEKGDSDELKEAMCCSHDRQAGGKGDAAPARQTSSGLSR